MTLNINTGQPDPDSTTRELTSGEILVGVNFNPSQDPKVARLKALFAEAIDIMGDYEDSVPGPVVDAAIGNIITAQMWSVKVATFK